MDTLPIFLSPAKVNFVLDLIRKREDGYHEVEFVMQELELHDTITLESVEENTQIQIQCTDASVPTNEKNTCHHAARLMQAECEKKGFLVRGVQLKIEKHIPSAGGLGGGSSNAAAVLKGLNELWSLHLSKNVLSELAAKIGSDVPFFIHGKTCLARGRGEIIEPIEPCPRLELAFIVPPVNVPTDKTRWIYSHFHIEQLKYHPSVSRMREAIRSSDVENISREMGNVFETLDVAEYAVVFALIEGLKQMPGIRMSMLAGAGPTVVCVCDSEKIATQIIEPFRARGWVAFATHTV